MTLTFSKTLVSGVSIEMASLGSGSPLLFLHGGFSTYGHEQCLSTLSKNFNVIAPILPGFGHSELPRTYNDIHDLAYFCLDLIAELELNNVTLVGSCFGGWVAAEMAIRSTQRLNNLILISALGAKFGDHLTRDITDIHAMYEADVQSSLYADPARAQRETKQLTDDELTAMVRTREAFTLFGWKPYMHNPKLTGWLHRVDLPSLLIWGKQDGMVSLEYGQKYAAAITGSLFEAIDDAGHYPSLEQPETVSALITDFVNKIK